MPSRKKSSTEASAKLPKSPRAKLQWDDFRYVEAVARRGSLNQAASELDVEQTTVTYRISRLEKAIGRPLFTRSKRGAKPTLPGKRMADAVSEAATIFQRAMDQARAASHEGEDDVKIASPEGLASLWLPRFFPWFAARYDRVSLTVSPFDPFAEAKTERFDSGIQLLRPTALDLIAAQVGTLHFVPYSSEIYVRRFGKPETRKDLMKHRLIDLTVYLASLGDWVRWVGDESIRRNRILTTDFTSTFVNAIRAGIGIGLLPTYVSAVFPDLVPCDVGIKLPGMAVWHVYHERSTAGRVNPAVALIRHAFDERKMPWFAETYIPPDNFFQRGRELGIPL